ncbi:hypothetical protein WJX84_000771 [Apatococcus fuscideae]|uniref:Uncharacterized protein n=1 Tax=Apatococcus fuscideae TaxID=2026836 RepID=A0AAW1SY92_9CHLO
MPKAGSQKPAGSGMDARWLQGQLPAKRPSFIHTLHGFFVPLTFELYYEVPMLISRLQLLMQFRMGSHSLAVEQVSWFNGARWPLVVQV